MVKKSITLLILVGLLAGSLIAIFALWKQKPSYTTTSSYPAHMTAEEKDWYDTINAMSENELAAFLDKEFSKMTPEQKDAVWGEIVKEIEANADLTPAERKEMLDSFRAQVYSRSAKLEETSPALTVPEQAVAQKKSNAENSDSASQDIKTIEAVSEGITPDIMSDVIIPEQKKVEPLAADLSLEKKPISSLVPENNLLENGSTELQPLSEQILDEVTPDRAIIEETELATQSDYDNPYILKQTLAGYEYAPSLAKDYNRPVFYEEGEDDYGDFYYPFNVYKDLGQENLDGESCIGGACTNTYVDAYLFEDELDELYYDPYFGYTDCDSCSLNDPFSDATYFFPSTGCTSHYCVPRYVDYNPEYYYTYPIYHGHRYGPYFSATWGY